MSEILQSIFGVYTPITTEVYSDAGEYVGTVVASGMAGVDWQYLAGVALFAIVLISVFKLLGVILKNG